MKKGKIFTSVGILTIMLMLSGTLYAQNGRRGQQGQRGARMEAALDLTETQKEKLSDLRAKHQKDLRYQQNILNEKNARLKTLMSAPEQDMKEINSTIDEISVMKGDLMKKRIANKNEMKAILTPEQIQKFESLGLGNGINQRFGERGNRDLAWSRPR